jgi:hemerythrin-like domain-containing protein
MQLIEELQVEHELIEAGVGALRTFVERRIAGAAPASDGPAFVRFLRVYAAGFHHAREEDTLFRALVESAHLPEAGPIATLKDDHQRTAALLAAIETLIAVDPLDEENASRLRRLTTEYSRALWHHIDAENSVLFPESESRLRKHGVLELPSRPMSMEEQEARELGRDLVRTYPPVEDKSVIRGDGCVCCPALVDGDCPGLEHAWWNESEWDELEDHLAEG